VVGSQWWKLLSASLGTTLGLEQSLDAWILIKEFSNNHFTFHLSFIPMNYSYRLGYLLLVIFPFQFITGIFLARYYTPSNTIAYDTVFYIMIDVNFGWPVRWYHVLGASLYMPLLLLHGSRGIRLKLRFGSLSVLWISGFILLGIPLAEGFLGYILDWGQMSYRGVTAMINILVTLFPVYMSSCLPESIWRSCNVIISRMEWRFIALELRIYLLIIPILIHLR